MSAGERAKASLVVQAVNKPALWLLDEPTLRIPSAAIVDFSNQLRLRAPLSALIVISHDTDFLEQLAERQLKVLNGVVYNQ